MTTAKAIDAITDPAVFERLAIQVLRIEDEDCRMLEHTGVSATGKCVADPLDGFCLVPGTKPERFIMVASTTTEAHRLKRKWLFDHRKGSRAKSANEKDDGDLVKAARLAEDLRKDYPNAVFRLHLCTNRSLDSDFMTHVYKAGKQVGVTPVFLAQSRIRDCLDSTPEGHWLREQHLGITAQLLSRSLLASLSAKSLAEYATEFILASPEAFVSTEAQSLLSQSLRSSERTLHILTGNSGFGKSVVSYQVMRKHIESGGIGLRIPGEIAASATSREDAITRTLRSLHPHIEKGAGSAALKLTDIDSRLMLVFDDINRGGNPKDGIGKVLTWAQPRKAGNGEEKVNAPWTIILPAWDVFWASFEKVQGSPYWLCRMHLSRMSEGDSIRCLLSLMGRERSPFPDDLARRLVLQMGCDPILIAMFAELCKNTPSTNPDLVVHEVMHRFIHSATAEAVSEGTKLQPEYQDALLSLARCMLQHRELYPHWTDCLGWLNNEEAQAIRDLAKSEKICHITQRNLQTRFDFRHDRILEYHLVKALSPMLQDPQQNADVLSDPFFANFLGQAIATTNVSQQTIGWVKEHNPLALITAIRFLSQETTGSTALIVGNAEQWLLDASTNIQVPSAMVHESCRVLEETDSAFVLEITDGLRGHPIAAMARLANGDALAGAIQFSGGSVFWPSMRGGMVDSVLSRALHNNKTGLIDHCDKILQITDLDKRLMYGALSLAGFIAEDCLVESIKVAWQSSTDKEYILVPAIWAGVRCSKRDPETILSPMMDFWAGLPEEAANGSMSKGGSVSDELRLASWRGIGEAALRYLVEVGCSKEQLIFGIAWALREVDHPVAIDYLVTLSSALERHAENDAGISPFAMSLLTHWDSTNPSGHRLSRDSLEAIRQLWDDNDSEDGLKTRAFDFWRRATDDLEELRAVSPESPHFEAALWKRAQLGDKTAAQHVAPLLSGNPNWFHVVPHIWCDDFLQSTDKALLALGKNTPRDFTGGDSNTHYMLAKLLRVIPQEDAQRLLEKHWKSLKYSRVFMQAALYIGTEQCIRSFNEALTEWPSQEKPFEHIAQFFGFWIKPLSDRISMRHLNTCLPYIEQLDDHALHDMLRYCLNHGQSEWADQHLRHEINSRRAIEEVEGEEELPFLIHTALHYYPTDKDLLRMLDDIEEIKKPFGRTWRWSEGFEERGDDPNRWRKLIKDWLTQDPSILRFQIAAEVIMQLGSRKDLQLLTECDAQGPPEQLERIRNQARFSVMRGSLR
ncbi:hypothetical protein ACFL2Q_06385 [Thermodesulfobacteriota bacterium]